MYARSQTRTFSYVRSTTFGVCLLILVACPAYLTSKSLLLYHAPEVLVLPQFPQHRAGGGGGGSPLLSSSPAE
ncbi:hypothetical protein C8F04DRAFT_1060048 [Mycena alexandri]|uniref:Uncharacterized protein n=1 Tax=Mycena alexandri TaxID=1745969 RepID=A0AAD6XK06_9AGAR|nr:hypothetical protein C8F04DRAFT_1060048 [Mycena alexandri]